MNRLREPHFVQKQNGAVLFVALVMLLIITLLAVTSMREVTLEARITGNLIEQKRLTNAAESALREGERRLSNRNVPPDLCAGAETVCVRATASTYDTDFSGAAAYKGLNGATTLDRTARWYIRDATNVGNVQASCPQPEDVLTGKNCTNYYEVNAQAYQGDDASKDCGPDALCIRSVVAVIYN